MWSSKVLISRKPFFFAFVTEKVEEEEVLFEIPVDGSGGHVADTIMELASDEDDDDEEIISGPVMGFRSIRRGGVK